MAERLKNTLSFVDLASGASIVLPHGLETSRPRPLAPDIVFIPSPSLTVVAADTLNVTLRNDGPATLSGAILVEAWHTIERAFDGVQFEDLPVKPYVVVSVEGNGAPPQPPFSFQGITIYARTTGSDVTGDGTSIATAYRTFQRAVRDVPTNIPAGTRYRVNITGITEELPPGYRLPAWKCAELLAVDLAIDFASPYFIYTAGVNIDADPQLTTLLSVADATILPGDIASQIPDPITGQITLTLNAPRASWGGDALKGKSAQGTAGNFDNGVIYESTPTTIKFLWPFPLTAGPAITIVEPSAHLTGTQIDGFEGALVCYNQDSLSIAGVHIEELFGGYGLVMNTGAIGTAQRCDLVSPSFQVDGGTDLYYRCAKSWVKQFPYYSGPCFLVHCLMDQCNTGFLLAAPILPSIVGCVFDGCEPVHVQALLPPSFPTSFPATVHSMQISATLIRNGVGDGVIFHGSYGVMVNCDVYGNAGNGVTADLGSGLLELQNVQGTGAPNGGVGVRVNGGLYVKVDAATSGAAAPLTGAGGDMSVGVLPVRAWANFTGVAPINNQFDLVGQNAGATDQSTGSRLYQ